MKNKAIDAARLKIKLFVRRLAGREPWLRPQITVDRRLHGDWAVCPGQLRPNPIIYSVGVGNDVGFDFEMIRDYGAQIYAFDPTPGVDEWVEGLDLPDSFHYFPWAVAGSDGDLHLYPRVSRKGRLSDCMYTVVSEPRSLNQGVTVPAKSLGTIARELGHGSIDVLKLDVEGAEYEILETLSNEAVLPQQMLIEFHHRFAGLEKQHTEFAVARLHAIGYRIMHISQTGREYSFTRVGVA